MRCEAKAQHSYATTHKGGDSAAKTKLLRSLKLLSSIIPLRGNKLLSDTTPLKRLFSEAHFCSNYPSTVRLIMTRPLAYSWPHNRPMKFIQYI